MLRPANGVEGDRLGVSVALDGDTILAGAPGADELTGAVFVFAKGTNGWTQKQKLTPPSSMAQFLWGQGIALAGQTALVRGNGYVAVLEKDTTGDWSWKGILPLPAPRAYVLTDMSSDGTWAAVADIVANAVLIFKKGPSGWVLHSQVQVPAKLPLDQFARSVCISGSVLMVGGVVEQLVRPPDGDPITAASGRVWCYTLQSNAWKLAKTLSHAEGGTFVNGQAYGALLADQGNHLFVQSIHNDPTMTDPYGNPLREHFAIDVYDRGFHLLTRLVPGNQQGGC